MKVLRYVGARMLAVAGVVGLFAATASAQFVPEVMDPIVFPVTTASVIEEVLVAGAAILVAVFGVALGFALVRKLMRRLKGAV